jgi:hypothetical protein
MNRQQRRAAKRDRPDVSEMKALFQRKAFEAAFSRHGMWISIGKADARGFYCGVLPGFDNKVWIHLGINLDAEPVLTDIPTLDKAVLHVRNILTKQRDGTDGLTTDATDFTFYMVSPDHSEMVAVPKFFESDNLIALCQFVPESFDWEAVYEGQTEDFGVPQRIVDLFGLNQIGKPHAHHTFHVTMRRADEFEEGAIEWFLSHVENAIEKDDFMTRIKGVPKALLVGAQRAMDQGECGEWDMVDLMKNSLREWEMGLARAPDMERFEYSFVLKNRLH